MPNFVDLTGLKFGRLTVVSYSGSFRWHCRCDCGSEKDIPRRGLKNGDIRSCVTKNVAQWSRDLGVPDSTLRRRLKKLRLEDAMRAGF